MKRLFIISLTIILFCCYNNANSVQQNEKYVYICQGPKSKKYHKTSSCRGLDKCSTKLKKVSLNVAKTKYKRTACKVCYKY